MAMNEENINNLHKQLKYSLEKAIGTYKISF